MRDFDLNKVADELKDIYFQTRKPTCSILFEVNELPHNIKGRQTDTKTLYKLMLKSRERETGVGQFVAVTGLGGIGKSTLCTKYAYDHRRLYQNILWINAETSDSINTSFQRLCTQLGIARSKDLSIEDLLKAVVDYFRNNPCLFIFNNLVELEVLKPFRSQLNTWSVQPFVPITTRILNIVPFNLHLNTLTEKEASDFVLAEVINATQSDADELVQLLDCLPLTMQQAVAYIRETFIEYDAQTPIEKYIAQFKTSAANLLSDEKFRHLNSYEKTTYTTWTVTLDRIKAKSAASVVLLEILSFLNPDKISVQFTSRLMQNDLEQSLMVLKKYSMINLDYGLVRIHRLVQHVVMLGLGEDMKSKIFLSIVKAIDDELEGMNFNDIVRECVSDGLHFAKTQHIISMPSTYLNRLCWYLGYYGNRNDSLEISSMAVEHFTSFSGPNHYDTLVMKLRKGETHISAGNYIVALAILENTHQLAVANTEIGKEYQLTLRIQQSIARAYLHIHPGKSLRMCDELIPIMEEVFGKMDGLVLSAIHNKAFATRNFGNLDEALTAFKSVHEMEVSAGVADNVDGLITKFNIADLLCRKGDFDQALPIVKEVFEGQLSMLGETHSDTIWSQNLINEVETELHARAVEHHTSLAGPHHLDTLVIKWRMGADHITAGNNLEAVAILENTLQLAIANTEIGKEHLLSLRIQQEVARASLNTDPGKSLKMYDNLIPIVEKVLEKNHELVVVAIRHKAFAMRNLDKLDEALTTLKLVHGMEVSKGETNTFDGLRTKFEIANVLYGMGYLNQALPIVKEVFQVQLSLLGETHPHRVMSRNLITQIEKQLHAKQKQNN